VGQKQRGGGDKDGKKITRSISNEKNNWIGNREGSGGQEGGRKNRVGKNHGRVRLNCKKKKVYGTIESRLKSHFSDLSGGGLPGGRKN